MNRSIRRPGTAPSARPSRRSVLVQGVRLTALGALAPGLGALPSRRGGSSAADAPALVVVQLTGGNDGLNTVVPHGQDAYYRLRPTLAQKPSAVHRLDDDVALHPSLGGLAGLYREGALTVAHGVGHPAGNRSHFRSMEIWHTAEPFAPAGRVGWLGHLADQLLAAAPGSLPALAVGGAVSPLSMRGAAASPPAIQDERGFRLPAASRAIAGARGAIVDAERGVEGDLGFLRRAARVSYDAAERMAALADRPGAPEYPGTDLARRLRLVARLVRGGFGARVFQVELGGFDTHASQGAQHARLLAELDGALAAFQRDLTEGGRADDVVTMVFSEFGRRARENGSRGTDHGRGNPVLFLGGPVVGGQVGQRPDLDRLVDGDVPSTTDFRGLYRQLEEDWMGLERFTRERIEAPRILG